MQYLASYSSLSFFYTCTYIPIKTSGSQVPAGIYFDAIKWLCILKSGEREDGEWTTITQGRNPPFSPLYAQFTFLLAGGSREEAAVTRFFFHYFTSFSVVCLPSYAVKKTGKKKGKRRCQLGACTGEEFLDVTPLRMKIRVTCCNEGVTEMILEHNFAI